MKKNFFKKLSFVLALAMVVSMISPAAGAFAATKQALNSSKKYLFLGEDGKNEFDFNIKNKVKGCSYEWSSSNEDVATVDGVGLTTGVSIGNAKVTVKITKKGMKTVKLTSDVIVKDNIKTVAISNKPENDTIAIGDTFDFNRSYTTQSGSTTKTTSITKWFITSDNKDTASIDKTGVFTATKDGEYKVQAMCFQSGAKFTTWQSTGDASLVLAKSDEYTVKVVNKITKLTQVDPSSFTVSFVAPVESLAKADVAVSYVVSATKSLVPQVVKSVTLSEDKKSATVVMYNAFAGGSDYKVEVKGFDAQTLTAATQKVEDVDHMTITPSTAVVNTATDIVVKLFNKDGVDITTTDLLNRVTLTSSSEKVLFGAKKLTMFNVNDTTTIDGTFHTYNYDTNGVEQGNKTASTTVTCVAATNYTLGSVTAWTIAKSAPADDFATVKHNISISDNDGSYKLYVKALKTDGTTVLKSADLDSNFKLESTNNSKLIINDNKLYPVASGSVDVLVEYRATATDAYAVVGTATVVVGEARVATTLTLGATSFSLTNSDKVNQTKDVSIAVTDQFGDTVALTGVAVSKNDTGLTSDLVKGGATNVSDTAGSVTFEGVPAGVPAAAGTYSYKITANGLSKYVTINVSAPTNDTVAYYKLSVDNTSYDAKLAASTDNVKATVNVYGYATNGVANSVEAVTGPTFTVKLVKPDGTDGTALIDTDSSATTGTIQIALANASGTATKVATGVYTLKLYNKSTGVLLDTAQFEVKDTTVLPTAVTNKIVAAATDLDITTAVNDCFTVTFNGVAVNNGTTLKTLTVDPSDIIGHGATVFVKNVRYTDTVTGYTYVIAVNTYITLGFTY